MSEALVVSLILAAIVGFTIWFKFYKKKAEWFDEAVDAMNGIGLHKPEWQFTVNTTTPAGAKIRSVVPVPQEALEAIDAGLRRGIDRFNRAFPNWTFYKNISDVDIFLVPPRGVSVVSLPGAPVMHVGGISSAGTVLGCHERYEEISVRPIIVVPHQQEQQWRFLQYLSDSVHNEYEHLRGWTCRNQAPVGVFYLFLGQYDVHPWPIDNLPVALPQIPSERLVAGLEAHNCGVH